MLEAQLERRVLQVRAGQPLGAALPGASHFSVQRECPWFLPPQSTCFPARLSELWALLPPMCTALPGGEAVRPALATPGVLSALRHPHAWYPWSGLWAGLHCAHPGSAVARLDCCLCSFNGSFSLVFILLSELLHGRKPSGLRLPGFWRPLILS